MCQLAAFSRAKGGTVSRTCRNGHETPDGQRYCGTCGVELDQASDHPRRTRWALPLGIGAVSIALVAVAIAITLRERETVPTDGPPATSATPDTAAMADAKAFLCDAFLDRLTPELKEGAPIVFDEDGAAKYRSIAADFETGAAMYDSVGDAEMFSAIAPLADELFYLADAIDQPGKVTIDAMIRGQDEIRDAIKRVGTASESVTAELRDSGGCP